MAGKKTEMKVVVPVSIIILVVIVSRLSIPLLIGCMLLLPLAAALLEFYCRWPGAAAVCFASGVACGFALPAAAIPVTAVWCIGSFAAACAPVQKPILRPVLWSAVCLAAWCAGLVTLNTLTGGQIVDGLARSICDFVGSYPQRDVILVNAYSMGFCRLESTEGIVRTLNGVVIEEQTALQMLYSLRVSLEESLPSALCDTVIYHTVLTTLLCTALPDWRRRKSGEKGKLPPMEQWYMPRRMGTAVFALLLGWVVSLLATDGLMQYLGMLCADVFRMAFMLQGICYLMWMGKRIGIRSVMRNIWAVVLCVLAPIIPIIMGVVDQRRDSRHLRPNKEAEQE